MSAMNLVLEGYVNKNTAYIIMIPIYFLKA